VDVKVEVPAKLSEEEQRALQEFAQLTGMKH
jgi:DnaJ-class molecular chaperone